MSRNRKNYEIQENDNHFDFTILPDINDSEESETDSIDEIDESPTNENNLPFPEHSYSKIHDDYNNSQKKIEEKHEYVWLKGEKIYNDPLINEILLSNSDTKIISNSSCVELFEFFFSHDLKTYIIEATQENGYKLSMSDLNTFLGIMIFSTHNRRLGQRDYWSSDPFLSSHIVSEAISRNKFELIKKHLKYCKLQDKKESDKVWRVRPIVDIFKRNIMKFGVFCTALSIDEMMVKYYGRFKLKQFIKSKPIRFGIKLWALCSANGYAFNFDIYCGKNEEVVKLAKCALGSRVVLSMLEEMLKTIPPRKLMRYHVYFDNLFCSPDLLVHLKKVGIRATGTVRENRINVKNTLDKKAPRGTHLVQHDKKSRLNFITVQDSKPVSILSTAAGVSPLGSVERYDREEKARKELPFPNAFRVYNQFMGGVDIHDQYCSRVLPIFRSKKWTWVILMRLIQTAITNATVIWNTAQPEKKRGVKDFALDISKHYLQVPSLEKHDLETGSMRSHCSVETCGIRTSKLCKKCDEKYFCVPCFRKVHNK